MDTFAQAALLVLAMILYSNYRNGTLGDWVKAKFLNKAAPSQFGDAWGDGGTTGGGEAGSGGGGGAPKLINAPSDWLGKLVWPLKGTLTGRFGEQRPGHLHAGIDEAVPIGTAVGAAAAGKITYAGPSAGYGNRVDVDHGNGTITRYAHLSAATVRVGQTVTAGQQIALSGNTGASTGPHLHFEVLRDGVAVDPLPYLGPINPAVTT